LEGQIRSAVTDEAATNGVSMAGCQIDIAPDPGAFWGCVAWTPPAGTPLVVTVTCPYQTNFASITGIPNFLLSNLTARGTMSIFGNDTP